MNEHTTTTTEPPLVFESPDGHVWERDVDHQSEPIAPYLRRRFLDAFHTGMPQSFGRMGAPIAGARCCSINGWFYLRFVPAGAPDKPGAGPPPRVVLSVLTRLHPELRRRERVARRMLAEEGWRDDVAGWWQERPTWAARFSARGAVDPTVLSDDELADEIAGANDEGVGMLERHFALIGPGLGVGVALVAAAEHGIDPATAAEALRGASRSTSAPLRALEEIRRTIDDGVLASAGTLDELRSSSPEVAAQIDAYLDEYGWRVLGDDVALPTLAESPDILLRSLQSTSPDARPVSDAVAELVEQVPSADRPRVERLLRNAGEAYEMLDDNSAVVCWGIGVLRRLVLAAAPRLVAAGVLEDVDQVFLLDADELVDALRGQGAPTTEEVAARDRAHRRAATANPPDVVGGEPAGPPDPSVFPPGLRAVATAIGTYIGLRFPKPEQQPETGRVECGGSTVATGFGVGSGSATGRAVVATSAMDAMDRLEPGDVLVCAVTNPAYNAIFPIASAVVTAAGGPLGHTAVTAREVGIPAVVGIGDLGVIDDGAEITVVGG